MENLNFTDVSYSELKDDIYYTAVQVAEILNEPVTTIRNWAKDESFGDLLELKRENGRRKYTKKDIDNLKFIKELVDKKYSYTQIREIISKRGFSFGEYNSGLINPNDPLGFEALAIQITQKQDEKLEIMKNQILDNLKTFMEIYAEAQNQKLNYALDEFNESLDSKLERHESSTRKLLDDIETNQKNRDLELLDNFHDNLEESQNNFKSSLNEIKETFKVSYVTKEEIESLKRKKTFLGWLKK
ncbi:helix-turn-helix domain-containing protein [Clostridium sp.]|uniref:helix-turn-helix domain-containing protein n=1 Tax=Clostridium sp. TaxID=1506 RepID=UPI001DD12584|nr:helix-turn-helix domain-containing protein [Clostridium sp.]MBS5307756.1 MerR family transcriptional regulator [Clostridium sp.]